MMDRNLLPARRRVGNVFRDGIVDLQLSALLQQQDGRRRELLRDRTQAKLCIRGIRDLPLDIGPAKRLIEQRLVMAGHEYRAHESIIGRLRRHDLLHARDILPGAGQDRRQHQPGESSHGFRTLGPGWRRASAIPRLPIYLSGRATVIHRAVQATSLVIPAIDAVRFPELTRTPADAAAPGTTCGPRR